MSVGRQIRAGRGLLKWSAQELAKQAGLTRDTINKIEDDAVQPREGTLNDIRRVFDENGIEFTDGFGVKLKPQGVDVLTGQDGLITLMEDVYESCRKGIAGDIVLSGIEEDEFVKQLGEYDDIYIAKMSALEEKIHMRHLIAEGDYNVVSSEYSKYRWVPKDKFKAVPFYVYADKLAIIIFSSTAPVKIYVIQAAEVAEAYRHQFDAMWTQAQEIPERASS